MTDRGRRKTFTGTVVSDKMDKTVVVKVMRQTKHKIFKKVIVVHKKFKAHDQNNEFKVDDKVIIIETRPLSKDKRWRVLEKL